MFDSIGRFLCRLGIHAYDKKFMSVCTNGHWTFPTVYVCRRCCAYKDNISSKKDW